jgi:DNA-binding MarR family transcriptional regulator
MAGSIGKYISGLARRQQMMVNHYLKEYDISDANYSVLMTIIDDEGINPKEIGKRLFLDKGSAVRNIQVLEDRGYIFRKQNPDDKRGYRLFLTEKGRECSEEFKNISRRFSEIATSSINSKSLDEYVINTEKIINNIKNELDRQNGKGSVNGKQ